MAQLAYIGAHDPHHEPTHYFDVLTPTLSLLGDEAALEDFASDARKAGLNVRSARPLDSLLDGNAGVLGDIVIVDCPAPSGTQLAALLRLDERAARAGAQLVVSTSRVSLEDVFGCLERSDAQILVDPTAAQRALALGAALMRLPSRRVREMGEEERLALLQLTEQVARLAAKIDGLSATGRLAAPGEDFRGSDEGDQDLWRPSRVPLPDPRLIHRIIRQRRLRERFFDSALLADPAWDILLDLTAARAEHRRVSVTSLCIAAAVPATTALRWIAQMTEMRILVREQDEDDKRRAFIYLSDRAADAMARFFQELGKDAPKLI